MKQTVDMTVNGDPVQVTVEPWQSLLDTLREELLLTGTKKGCDEGDCGACTVIMDGKAVTSCMVLALTAQGKGITTIEGLAEGERLHPLQQAFLEEGGVQCGYCTPGLIVNAVALLKENPDPTEEDVRYAISGNLCRCTGYSKVVLAIQKAAQAIRRG
ncbi:MAG: (2Fe-2S)-binding protein [Dehalococcoidia bacterium]